MTDKNCLYPHIALTVEAFGEVRLCTSAMDVEFDLKKDDLNLQEVLNSDQILAKRDLMSRGELPLTCRSCKKVEDSGVKSKREIFNRKREKKYGNQRIDEILSNNIKKPLHMSIGFSNNCNLQCSMCSSKYSQAWRVEESSYNQKASNLLEVFDPFSIGHKNLDQLVEIASECTDIFVKGGEPFYSKEALYFLNQLKKKSATPHIFIQTNGTVVTSEVKSLIEDLNIEVGVSIDGVEKTYEWIRGYSYNQLLSNLSQLSELSTEHKISLDFTASLFNCTELADSLSAFDKLMKENPKISHISLFSIARQMRNSLLSLPLSLRESELEKLSRYRDIGLESFEVLEKTLQQKQVDMSSQKVALHWLHFLEMKRGSIPARNCLEFNIWAKGIAS